MHTQSQTQTAIHLSVPLMTCLTSQKVALLTVTQPFSMAEAHMSTSNLVAVL